MNKNHINPTDIFLKEACVYRIKLLLDYYNNPKNIQKNDNVIETKLLTNVVSECMKKKCSIDKYNLYGECLDG